MDNRKVFDIFKFRKVIKKDDFPLTNNVDTQEQNDQLVDDPDPCSTQTKIIQVYPKTKFGTQNRSFTSVYYTHFDWLEYSVKINAVFCFACRIFSNDYGNSENTFTITGFSNWKKASNFKELCKLVSKHDADFEQSYLQKINLSSWKVQEELIKMCADQVKEIILNQIVNVGFFAIMCDEARCYREEQLSICVRYVVDLQSARNVFNILEAAFVHFSRPSNHLKLSEIQSKLGIKKGNILRICDTRWVCRYKNCEAMLINYTAIVDFLNYEVEEQADKDVAQAMGILSSIQKSEFVVVLTILKEVLSIINVLSNTLQNKCATLGMSKNVILGVITTFENLRSDNEFSNVWRKIMHIAEKIGICLQNPSKGSKRQRREPKNLHDYVLTTTTGAEEIEESTSVETFWKTTAYMCIMDTVINNLKYRFSDESLLMANSIDSFCNLDYTNSLYFTDHYKSTIDAYVTNLRDSEQMTIDGQQKHQQLFLC
ncbi:hypothetical protein ACI65C_013399 [Semiaphis heraclei]